MGITKKNIPATGENSSSHWDGIYATKQPNEVSWTQEIPQLSLDFIHSFGLSKTAKIIDIGGGDSKLVNYLLDEGYQNITVLDISEKALIKAQKRLGKKAGKVNWIVSDILDFKPTTHYDVWHDRATFHFLTSDENISRYLEIAKNYVDHYMVIGTFSTEGPTKCSGLDIKQYEEQSLSSLSSGYFEKLKCIREDHITPFNTIQNFIFCSFKKYG